MKEIRKAFHDIANHLNSITIKAGTAVEILKLQDIDKMSEKEAKDEFKKTLEILESAVSAASTAGKTMNELRKKIYGLLKIDKNKSNDQEKNP